MASDFTNRAGAPPTHLILPGHAIPKPPNLAVVNPAKINTQSVARNPAAPVVPSQPMTLPTDDRVCYVQNSKNGDILNVLPILYQRFSETGKKQVLYVSRDFAGLLRGCSYVEPFIWEGDWVDLNGALRVAQSRFKRVVSLSTYGKTLSLTKQTPSFALEQWRLGEVLDKFDGWPLVFDNRNEEREEALRRKYCEDGLPYILLGDHSQSSPFPQMDDLVQLLKNTFGSTHKILRLSEVHAEEIYDLLGLYDRATALVSIETMHLHLSQASGVPVIALVTDKPEIWHGTPWHKNFLLHCRYADYENRKLEILSAVSDAANQREMPYIEVTGTGGYNMTIIEWNEKRIAVYRWHPKPDLWRTELAGWTGEKTVRIIPPKGFEQHSIEDGRLFVHNGKLHLSYTLAQMGSKELPYCVVQYGELDTSSDTWRIVNYFQPKYGKNDFTGMEKNFVFFEA